MFKKLLSAATAFTLASGVVLPGLFSGADDTRVFADESMELYVDQVTAAPGEEGVPVTVGVRGNTGISGIGARIEFNTEKSQWDAPSPLSIQLDDDGKTPIWEKGDVFRFWETDEKGVSTIAANLSQDDYDIVGASATGIELCIDDGSFYTVYFDVPQDAQPGDVYSLNLVVVDLLGPKEAFSSSHRELVEGTDFTVVNGSITISGDTVTTETASTETTTQTTPAESDMMQLYVDRVTAAPGEEGVPIKVNVRGNTGISGIGARIEFNTEKSQWDAPSPLSIQLEDDGKTPIWDKGDLLRFWESYASGISTISTNFAREDCDVVGASATGLDEYTGDGSFYTVYFDIPWDAQPGDVYPLNLVVVDLLGPKEEDSSSRQDLIEGTDFTVANGSITIAGEAVTTTESTTTATETTTTTEPVDTFGYCGAAGNEENVTWNFDPDTGELVISGSGDMADYGYSFSPDVPWDNLEITSVSIGNGVTNIGDYAFVSCSMTSIDIPSSVKRIGVGPFAYSSITSIDIPKGVKSVGARAFWGCDALTSVIISDTVTVIDNFAFSGCGNLISVTIPNSVTYLGEAVFEDCTALTSLAIPNSITRIEFMTFIGCTSLTSVDIPNSVTEIGSDAFGGCTSLTSVDIPNSVTEIGYDAFAGCTALTSVTIPGSVIYIGEGAFWGCTALTSVTIPESVTEIGVDAFEGTAWLNSKFEQSPFAVVNGILFDIDISVKEGDIVIPNGVAIISSYVFFDCDGLTSVKLSDSVKMINAFAFSDCDSLSSIVIPNGLTSIGYSAFFSCDSLTSLVIPESVKTIELLAFGWCENLSEVYIKNPYCAIGDPENDTGETICNDGTSSDDGEWGIYYGTIYGYENSTAQAYAQAHAYDETVYHFESLGTAPGTIPSTPGGFGDVDGTGNITIDDATMTLQVYTNQMLHVDAGVTEEVMKAMDLDEDGAVTIDDATYILAYYTAESVTHTPMTWYEITGNPNAPGAPE